MDMDSTFACGGWPSMHQPVDWDYTGFLPDMFAPVATSSPVPQQQQNQQEPQQQQQTAVNATPIVPAPPTYATFHGTWASSMHQPVDWEVPALLSTTSLSAPQPAVQPLQAATSNVAAQQQPAPSAIAPAQPASSVLAPAATATGTAAKEPGSNNSNKRERGARRAKSTTLRPQQQQMLDLQKKLDALLQEHAVVEAENERLKTRLRVLEAVLPVRQQQARWAQSKARTATAPPADPVIASLIDLATSGPSSCATSPARGEAATLPCAACGGTGCGAGTGGADAAGGGCTTDDATAAAQGDNMATGSPPLAVAHAEPASSSCGTTNTTTSGSHPPATRGPGHHRSCSVNTTTRGCGAARTGPHHAHPPHRHHSQHSLGAHGGAASSRDPHSDSHTRWLEAWRSWVREAALLLQAYDARPNDHYLNRLEEAFTKLKSEVVFLGLRHPELVCNMRCVNLETGVELEFPPDNFWSLVVAGMKLDAQQVANCKSALGLYRERMSVVLAERRSLAAQMSSCLTALQLEETDGRALPGSMRREQLTLEAEEAASALDANVAMEGHTTSLARDLLGSNLFSRLQVARASVLSYPYFPDALAIITAAVGDDGTAPPNAAAQPTRSGDAAQS